MRLFVVCLVAATLLWPALAQAPGDREFDECGDDDHTYPPEWHVLFDTWNYEDLFDGGPLQVVNEDGGNGWNAGGGGSCREQLRICDYTADTQPQNNWVFTQFINFDEAREIYVNASYQYIACINNERNGCVTLQTTVYRYETNGQVSNTERVNPANYLSNEVVVLDLTAGKNSGRRIDTFRPSSSASGFYLGVQDTGTCGSIERITVYYLVCPRRTEDLVTIPEIPRPPINVNTPIGESASCASDSTGSNLQLTCAADGTFVGSPVCLCNPGHEFVSSGGSASCQACSVPQYKAFLSNSNQCADCPINTILPTEAAAPICECQFSFNRPDAEPDDGCTRDPSSPRFQINRLPRVVNTDLEVCWFPTADRGGRDDFHYNIYVLLDTTSNYVRVNEDPIIPVEQSMEDNNTLICYTVSGLAPESSYAVLVVASNGATDDGESFNDVSAVRDRFISYFIITGQEASGGLSKAAAVVITFFVTAIFTAITTAIIVVAVCHYRERGHRGATAKKTTVAVSQTNAYRNGTKTEVSIEKVEIEYDESPSPIRSAPIRPPAPAIKPSAPPKPGRLNPPAYQ